MAPIDRYSSVWRKHVTMLTARIRVGQAAEMLGVSIETLRRWETDGRLRMERSDGGQRLIEIDEVARLLEERRRASTDRPIVAQSARNRFPGIVTRVERDGVAAVVEVIAGPHRMVSLMTAEAVDELDLKVGDEAVCVVKSTNVIVEIPSSRESRVEISADDPGRHRRLGPDGLFERRHHVAERCTGHPFATGEVSASANLELTVFGAASLKGVLDKAKAAYETAIPGHDLTISTDSSSALEMQIEQGAPADVFLSADTTNPKKLVDGGFADGAAVTFAGNKLTVIVPTANPAGITTPADLAKPGVKVIAAGD